MRNIPLVLLSSILLGCSRADEPSALEPGVVSASDDSPGALPRLADPGEVDARESDAPTPTSPAPPQSDPEDPPAVADAEPLPPRVQTLIEAVDAYGGLPRAERTPARREVYQTELLELGQSLTRLAREREGTLGVEWLNDKSLHVLEELAWEAGEDSAFGLKAYQLLADEKRRMGLEEEALWFEEAIERLLAEQAAGESGGG